MKLDENGEPLPQRSCNLCRYWKIDFVGRPGRLYRGDATFRKGSDHSGKGKTLRNHRRG